MIYCVIGQLIIHLFLLTGTAESLESHDNFHVWYWNRYLSDSYDLRWPTENRFGLAYVTLELVSKTLEDAAKLNTAMPDGIEWISDAPNPGRIYSVSQKHPSCGFQTFFPKRLGIFNKFFDTPIMRSICTLDYTFSFNLKL